ncbi:hypothetical protein N7492_001327 [Penicillium capsulatum]|uniref:Myb-like domain-containing protein n=1 Tax=Penicillium capsulatum TaxID=69766 RepID=A0A9W9IUH0_9EURO|nr:hypothetical protein N7492_001327 [Penicillium capsulatum]
MLTADPAWAAKANSFVSAIEDTPSVSSSFDLVDLRKEEVPVYHDLPFYSHDDASDAANKFQGSHLDYPALSLGLPLGYNEASWGMCSAQDPNPWRQPYIENADEQVWTSGEYFPTGWPGIGSHGSTVLTKSPGIQSYEPYQLIHLSSLDHHPDLRHPSTPIPSESDTEHTNPLPRALETSINIHSYQEYPNINPISQDPHSSQLPSATNYNHPPIPPPPPTQPIQHIASPEEPVGIKASLHYSDSRNAFLISCKQRGLSYKDIKRIGGFKEAESTLRGRFRTLTKTKEQRVRKPKWLDRDINLLCEAVTIYTEPNLGVMPYGTLGSDQPPKVSWKKVAQHIWTHGGSYEFGNATCKKKWCEIHDIKT